MRLLRSFVTSDAVEGAVEVRMELSEALHGHRSRLRLMVLALVVGVVLVFIAMLLQMGAFVGLLFEWFEGTTEVGFWDSMTGLLYIFFFMISFALGIAIVLFTGMMRRYFALMRARYGTIAGGGMGSPSRRPKGKTDADIEEEAGMVRDPARALLGLAREAEEEVPQVDELLKYSTVFTMLLAVMSLVAAGLTLLGASLVPDGLLDYMVLVHVAGTVSLACGVLLQIEAQKFINHFIHRVDALERFEEEGPIPVPEGKTALGRFAGCVLARHGLEGRDAEAKALTGASGDAHAFDMVLGGRGDRVLIRTYDRVPGIDDVRELRTAAEDVARKDRKLPLRVVALVTEEQDDLDVDDVVYDYLMEHQILDESGDWARSLQIVAEVEGYYSVLPFTVP
ncbi:MAG: hypothetical protein GWN18_11135 [Thermoplasmata archaeon]|nr:hypothetical protein [Thermoplasmata archaeon]NIS12588.1 hypothetical protein [Thermoplasmata archaeon]NIS20510.1 hypothetical protein [Thermoplasmata archaeon]NIT77886.1 hypothetical protein [Thermoplasmata archaeon]NIU49599.1 hypothetical protein [Thermoplasmata archaeon]